MSHSLPPLPLLSWLGRLGIGLATVCVLHCLAAPVLLSLVGVGLPAAEAVEAPLLLSSLLFAGYTSCVGVRLHGRRRLLLLPLAAAALVASGWGSATARYERMLVASGAMLLAAGQLFTHHLCRTCTHCTQR